MSRERAALELQSKACRALGSPLYAEIAERCARGADGGAVIGLLATRPAEENLIASVSVLRLLAAVHRIALAGGAPALALHYPSCGGDGDVERAWSAFVDTVAAHAAALRPALDEPVQTNEVGRAAPMLAGFVLVARSFAMPLRLLEVGASAGLTLRWDHFRYECAAAAWGRPDAPVRLARNFLDADFPFPADARVTVAERRGCDLHPIDATSDAGRLRLRSYVWPDQMERLTRLHGACELARRVPATVEKASATAWLARQLQVRRPGLATVVFHTIVLQYFSEAERAALERTIAQAGARATRAAPLAHLSLEGRGRGASVLLHLWPGDEQIEIARASYHGDDVRFSTLSGTGASK